MKYRLPNLFKIIKLPKPIAIIKNIFIISIFSYSIFYTFLYTTVPVKFLFYYLELTYNIKINYADISGSLSDNNGININKITVIYNKNNIGINNLALKIKKNNTIPSYNNHDLIDFIKNYQNYSLEFKTTDIDIPNIVKSRFNLNAIITYYKYSLYLDNNPQPILWGELHCPTCKHTFSNHLDLNLDLNKNKFINKISILHFMPEINKIHLKADFNKYKISWHSIANLDYNQNPLYITGHTDLNNHYRPLVTEVNLTSNNNELFLINNAEATIYGIPNLQLIYTPRNYNLAAFNNNLTINGNIFIPYGDIHPSAYSKKIKQSTDVVILQNNNTDTKNIPDKSLSNDTSNKYNLDINTNIELIADNNQLKFTSKDLKTKLSGQLFLSYKKQNNISSPTLFQGEVKLIDASYKLYGYPLKITQGKIIYNNNTIYNPNLNITGQRTVQLQYQDRTEINKYIGSIDSTGSQLDLKNENNSSDNKDYNTEYFPETNKSIVSEATVSINISNTLNNPDIKLEATEIMSEADKISYLLFGVPSYKTGAAQGQIILQTAKELFIDTNDGKKSENSEYNKVLKQLKSFFDFDEINIENRIVYNSHRERKEAQPTVILGKKFFKNFMLRYGFSLTQPFSMVSGEYKINKHLNIVATYNNQNSSGADIIYTNESDRLL